MATFFPNKRSAVLSNVGVVAFQFAGMLAFQAPLVVPVQLKVAAGDEWLARIAAVRERIRSFIVGELGVGLLLDRGPTKLPRHATARPEITIDCRLETS